MDGGRNGTVVISDTEELQGGRYARTARRFPHASLVNNAHSCRGVFGRTRFRPRFAPGHLRNYGLTLFLRFPAAHFRAGSCSPLNIRPLELWLDACGTASITLEIS